MWRVGRCGPMAGSILGGTTPTMTHWIGPTGTRLPRPKEDRRRRSTGHYLKRGWRYVREIAHKRRQESIEETLQLTQVQGQMETDECLGKEDAEEDGGRCDRMGRGHDDPD